ncbi:MAG: radical SAM protein [Bacillota bacterium]
MWESPVGFADTLALYHEEGDYILHNYGLNSWIVVSREDYNQIVAPLRRERLTPARVAAAYGERMGLPAAAARQKVGSLLLLLFANRIALPPHQPAPVAPGGIQGRQVPKIIYFVTTYRCNLSCQYCYADSSPEVETRGDLSTAEAMALIDQVAELGVSYMAFTGGEALLRKDCIDLIAHARSRGLKPFLITNGSPVTPEKVKRLAPLLSGVTVSMDSPAAEQGHDAVRGRGSWEAARRAIALFQEAGVPVAVNTTVTARSVESMPEMVSWALDRSIQTHRIGAVSDLGRGGLNPLAAGPLERLRAERGAHRILVERLDEVDLDGIKLFNTPLSPFQLKRHCGVGVEEISVDSLGDVYPCKLLHLPHLKAGNIRERSLREIWEGSEIFEAMLGVNPDNLPDCRPCTFRYICGGGCRAHQMSMTGDLYGTFNQDCPSLRRSLRRHMWLHWQKRTAGQAGRR